MSKEIVMKVSIDDEELERKLTETQTAMDVIKKNMTWLSDLIELKLTLANENASARDHN